ncbi:MAG TPA: hypothetical protein VFQ39_00225 [Longimicrobium sp.]|nr:hypothetical protein [Longimicrobium sp.]
MKKLKLELQSLAVESFTVLPRESARNGTVLGNLGEIPAGEVPEGQLPPDGTDTEYSGGVGSQRWYCTLTAFWVFCMG